MSDEKDIRELLRLAQSHMTRTPEADVVSVEISKYLYSADQVQNNEIAYLVKEKEMFDLVKEQILVALKSSPFKAFALFDPKGVMKKCAVDLMETLNYHPDEETSCELHNGIFYGFANKDSKAMKKAFEEHGWSVHSGVFVIND